MPDLKLSKLPDRTPVKLVLSISPELHRMLTDYAAVYRQTYDADAPIGELVPYMLEGFLLTDRQFLKARAVLGLDQA